MRIGCSTKHLVLELNPCPDFLRKDNLIILKFCYYLHTNKFVKISQISYPELNIDSIVSEILLVIISRLLLVLHSS